MRAVRPLSRIRSLTRSHRSVITAALAATIALTGVPALVDTAAFGAPTVAPARQNAAISLDGASNFRDIGGYETTDGKTVRSGAVFRSNKLSKLTDSDQHKLTDAGITLDIDLRNVSERDEEPDRLPAGIRYQVADVASFTNGIWFHEPVPFTLGRGIIDYYTSGSSNLGQSLGYPFMVSYHGSDVAYRDLLAGIARNPGATVFHCSAGKDRTGWGTAILLTILGVPRSTINVDFLKSNTYLGRDKAVELSWLNAAFDQVDRLYGGMDGYLRHGLHLTAATINTLRARLLS